MRIRHWNISPEKWAEKICSVINNSPADCTILLNFDVWMHYGLAEAAELWKFTSVQMPGKFTSVQMPDARWHPSCICLSRDNSTAYCLILLKSGTRVNHGGCKLVEIQ